MNKTTIRPQTKQQRRQDRREEMKRQQEVKVAGKKRRIITAIISVLVVAALGATIYFLSQRSATSDNPNYPAVDGIACQSTEQLAYHIHAHLTMYVNGQPFALPANVGIASDQSCYYWLHTHDSTGVIHIESPTQKTYTLGEFFHEWSTRFPQIQYPTELDSTAGWQVYVNGKAYTGDFHKITLQEHTLITLAYNSPGIKPDTTYAWQGL